MNIKQIELFLNTLEGKKLWDNDDLLSLTKFSYSKSSFIRNRVAEVCVYSTKDAVKDILIRLTKDDDDLVRTEALDSLSVFPYLDVAKILMGAIKEEKDELARSYAILSWVDVIIALSQVTDEKVTFLEERLQLEKMNSCALSCCYGLYLFGQKEYLEKIEPFLMDPDYHIRCASISLLSDLKSNSNKDIIQSMIIKLLEKEESIAVKDNANRLLEELKAEF